MQLAVDNHKPNIRVLMLGASLDVQGGMTAVEKLIINNTPPELQVSHVATFDQGSAIHNVIVFLKAIQSLIGAIITKKVDIVHIHFAERGSTLRKSILLFISLLFRQRILIHSHGATYEAFYDGLPSWLQKILVSLFSRCTKFIALSKSWQDYYAQIFCLDKNQITVLYNPVAIPASVPDRLGKKHLKFVFLGRIGSRGGALDLAKSVVSFPKQEKGSFELIRAFAELPASDREKAELVLAGNGDLETANQLIADLGMQDKITILSWISPEQRDELLAGADAFILPSYNEGLPMSMLESMAWGLPVIVTPVGGIPEVIIHKENGLLVEPGDKSQLMQAIQDLIQDEDLRISLGAAGRRSVEPLDIKNYMNSLVGIYSEVMHSAKI
jgi:glycosyltransferase involved in cell wall biosynthesis